MMIVSQIGSGCDGWLMLSIGGAGMPAEDLICLLVLSFASMVVPV